MKKTTKRYLISSLVLSTAFFGLLGANSIAANADGSPFNNFVISEVQVRNADPVGIRFVTDLTPEQKAAATEFGTLVIPVDLLTDENSDEAVNGFDLTYATENAAKIETLKWLDEDGLSYAGTIVGSYTDENVWEDLPKTFYGRELVARAYAIVNEEPVLSTNYLQKSIAQASAEILASEKEDAKEPIHQTIVDYVLNDEFGFDTDGVQMELGADPVAVALENKGLETVVTSGDDEIAYYANGKIYAGTKSGTTEITAKIGNQTSVVSVQVQDRTYAYGEISDMSYGADAFYHDYLAWGPSLHADLGTNYKGKITDYGVSKTLTDDEYQALLDAGYNGSKTSKTVWSTREKLHSEANETFKLHNGKAALVTLGSKSFSEKISDLLDDESVDMQGAYISVWVRTSVSVNYAQSYVNPMKAYGLYSGQHMDVQCMMTAPSGMQAANQWVELKLPVETLRTKLTSGDMKGLGFQFYLRTDTADLTGQTEGLDGIDIDYFDIYSVELVFPTKFNGYTFAEAATVSLPSLGVENFTENLEVYDGEDKLEAGVDYVYANGKLNGLAAGAYTLKNTISGDGLEQRILVRSYTITNQVAEMNTTDVVSTGWGGSYFTNRTVVAVDAKPDGYNGTRAELTAVKGNSSDHQLHIGINVEPLIANLDNLKDNQYLSVWVKFAWYDMSKETDGAPSLGTTYVQLMSQTNRTGATISANLSSSFVTAEMIDNSVWVNLRYTKAQLNVENVSLMKYLSITVNEAQNDGATKIAAWVYSAEVLTWVNNGVVDLNPNLMQATNWNGDKVSDTEGKNHRFATIAAPTAADGYNGPNHGDWALAYTSTSSYVSTGINISSFIANYDTLMDDNDVIEVWVRGTSEGSIWKWWTYLSEKPNRDTSNGAHYNVFAQTTTVTEDKWFKIEITKEQISAACELGTINWLRFYQNSDNNKTTHIYIYDILLVKN